jgi:hypothetical protein
MSVFTLILYPHGMLITVPLLMPKQQNHTGRRWASEEKAAPSLPCPFFLAILHEKNLKEHPYPLSTFS